MSGNPREARCGSDLQPVREAAARLSSVVAAAAVPFVRPRCSGGAEVPGVPHRHPGYLRRPVLRRTSAARALSAVFASRMS